MSAAPVEIGTPRYRVGTVVQLTGLSADSIRAWERRHGAVSPERTSGGTRLYSEADVARLQLLRALTEAGDAIGTIAELPDEALRGRLAQLASDAETAAPPRSEPEGPQRLAILDTSLAERIGWNAADATGLEVAWSAPDLERFAERASEPPADVVVVQLSLLGANPLQGLFECLRISGARVALVLYDFAPRRMLAQLASRGARLLRGPVSVSQLRQAIDDISVIRRVMRSRGEILEEPALAPPLRIAEEPPVRTFDDALLAKLREMRPSIDCECPNHLAQIVANLVAFEEYMQTCASRDAEDAAMHRALARGTGHARSQMEELLTRLCEHDGIRL